MASSATTTLAKKQALIIFDLSKTLLLASKNSKNVYFNALDELNETHKPDERYDRVWNIYYRPGRNTLLDYLFVKQSDFFDVGVWSSVDKDKTAFLCKSYFGRYYRNLLFVSTTRREEYEGVKQEYDFEPLPIQRDLKQVFDRFPGKYEHNNTIVVSNFQNKLQQYQINDIVLPQYDPRILGANFAVDLAITTLTKYLNGVRVMMKHQQTNDLRPILTTKSYQFMLERI